MGKSRTGDSIHKLLGSLAESQVFGRKVIEGMGMDSTVLQSQAPIDDEIAPITPGAATLSAFVRGASITFPAAPITDYVTKRVVEYKKVGSTSVRTHETKEIVTSIYALDGGVEYTFRYKNVDMWGRESGFSPWVNTTPTLMVDALAPNFAEGVVNSIALSQSNNTNLLTLREVDFEMWRDELYPLWDGTWPPPATVGSGDTLQVINRDPSGNPYIVALAQGHTPWRIETLSGRKWLRDTRPVGNSFIYSWPFSNYDTRGTVEGGWYIASAYVRGPVNGTAGLRVIAAETTAGAGTVSVDSTPVTLDGLQSGRRVWLKFQVPAGKPFIRIGVGNPEQGQTLYWTRFQLEATTEAKNEPSPWTPGVFTTGVIGARMIGTIDLSAANAIFENAAIQSAKISNLEANKIVAGSGLFDNIVMQPGGKLSAGMTTFSSTGLELGALSSELTDTTTQLANKIGPGGRFAAIDFVLAAGLRQVESIVQTNTTGQDGFNQIIARRGTTSMEEGRNAYIRVATFNDSVGTNGEVQLGGNVYGFSGIGPQYRSAFLQIGAGGTRQYNHNFGHKPMWWAALGSISSSGSSPFPLPSANVALSNVTNLTFDITNTSGAARWVEVRLWKDPTKELAV